MYRRYRIERIFDGITKKHKKLFMLKDKYDIMDMLLIYKKRQTSEVRIL